MSAAFVNKDVCMKMRFCNIFEITNAMKLIKAISESPHKVLQITYKYLP